MERLELSPKSEGYYTGYYASMEPNIANNFAASAFRFAHTLLPVSFTIKYLWYMILKHSICDRTSLCKNSKIYKREREEEGNLTVTARKYWFCFLKLWTHFIPRRWWRWQTANPTCQSTYIFTRCCSTRTLSTTKGDWTTLSKVPCRRTCKGLMHISHQRFVLCHQLKE